MSASPIDPELEDIARMRAWEASKTPEAMRAASQRRQAEEEDRKRNPRRMGHEVPTDMRAYDEHAARIPRKRLERRLAVIELEAVNIRAKLAAMD